MLVADQFCVSRLINLCELYITFEVDRKCCKQIEKSEIDVIGLLLGAQVSFCKNIVWTITIHMRSNIQRHRRLRNLKRIFTVGVRRMGKVLFSQVCVCPPRGWEAGLPHGFWSQVPSLVSVPMSFF